MGDALEGNGLVGNGLVSLTLLSICSLKVRRVRQTGTPVYNKSTNDVMMRKSTAAMYLGEPHSLLFPLLPVRRSTWDALAISITQSFETPVSLVFVYPITTLT